MEIENAYPQITRLVMEHPWAIMPGTLAAIRDLVALRAQGERLSDEEIEARIGAGPAHKKPQTVGSVAVIPVYGTIMPKADLMSEISGGTSVAALRSALSAAMGDSDIGAIVLDVDSPGGLTDLMPEFAADVRGQRGKKPMLAVANTLMASAAYWIASQADEVAASPSSLTGSIGVFASHQDLSAAQERLGVKTTMISAGKYKTEGNRHEPLSDEARGHIQSLVDSAYAQFTRDVAKGRGITVADVRGGFGEGRILPAQAAVDAGLADRVATLEQTIQRAAVLAAQPRGVAALAHHDSHEPAARGGGSFIDEVDAVLCMADELVAKGRPLTAAKRERLEALSERIDGLVTAKTVSEPDFDAEVRLAALRARARSAATQLRSK